MRIIGIRGAKAASGDFRISNPLSALQQRGHEVREYRTWETRLWSPAMFVGYDAVIVQQLHDQTLIDAIGLIPKAERPVLVYEVDDLIWQIGPERDDIYSIYQAIRVEAMRCLRRCDAVFCSTPELADECSGLNKHTFVLQNAIDLEFRDWTAKGPRCPNHELVIGWAGGVRAGKDFEPIGNGLRAVLEANPHVAFAICADPEIAYDFAWCMGVPEGQLYVLDLATYDSYPGLLSLFDIGIAPLADTRFNRCKSELKVMEYGAVGIPWVASAVAPYTRYHRRNPDTGLLACNSRHWEQGLSLYVRDAKERARAGLAGQEAVKAHYSLKERAAEYEEALRSIVRTDSPPRAREVAIR